MHACMHACMFVWLYICMSCMCGYPQIGGDLHVGYTLNSGVYPPLLWGIVDDMSRGLHSMPGYALNAGGYPHVKGSTLNSGVYPPPWG